MYNAGMLGGVVQKKSDWVGLIFLLALIGVPILFYVQSLGGATWAYPASASLAAAFGLGVLIQSIRLTKTSGGSRLAVVLIAIFYFVATMLMAAKNASSPTDVLNGLVLSYAVFAFFWYYLAMYHLRLAVDEVHLFAITIVAWAFFFDTSSWWWYGTLAATAVSLLALLRHGHVSIPIRLLLFGWFTAVNAYIVWAQFGSAYATMFSIVEAGESFSSSLASELFAAGLAAPVALFPLFHVCLVLPLALLIPFGHIRRRATEFREHLDSIIRSVENVSLTDWRVMGVVGGVGALSALAISGVLERTFAVNIAYALIGLWISLRPDETPPAPSDFWKKR